MSIRIVIAAGAAIAAAVGLTSVSSGASTTGTKLYSSMSGKQENPVADPDGTGTATLTIRSDRRLRYDIRPKKSGLTFLQGHIHEGKKGKDGGIVVDLFTTSKKVKNGRLTGNSKVVSRANLNKLTAKPGDFYVNLHSSTYKGGAIRGQLTKKKPS